MARTQSEVVVNNADCIKSNRLAGGGGGRDVHILASPATPPSSPKQLLLCFFCEETNTKRVSTRCMPTLPHITERLSTAREGRSHICSEEAAQWEGAAELEVPDARRVEPRRSLSSPATCKRKEAAWGEWCRCSSPWAL